MRVTVVAACVCLASITSVRPARSQNLPTPDRRDVIVNEPASIYLAPDTNRQPLRVAKEGSVLRLLERTGEWCHVEFQDPQFGRRVGYVQAKYLRGSSGPDPRLEPTDLSIPSTPQPTGTRVAPASQPIVPASSPPPPVPRALSTASAVGRPIIYVAPTDDGFHVFISAAITKKHVAVSITENPDLATLTLRTAAVDVQKESTGSKVVKCLFAYCADIADKATTSVQLVDHEGLIVWSYSVNKGRGAKNRQSMAEAIAKHIKDDCFRVRGSTCK